MQCLGTAVSPPPHCSSGIHRLVFFSFQHSFSFSALEFAIKKADRSQVACCCIMLSPFHHLSFYQHLPCTSVLSNVPQCLHFIVCPPCQQLPKGSSPSKQADSKAQTALKCSKAQIVKHSRECPDYHYYYYILLLYHAYY